MPKPKRKPTKKKATQVPFRDLRVDGVTYSFLSKFLTCRESARLSYVEGLDRDGIMPALDFGSAYHELLQHLAEGKPCTKSHLERRLATWLQQQVEWRRLKGDDYITVKRLTEQVALIFPHYVHFWKTNKGDEFHSDFVCQEESFEVQHPLPTGRSIKLRGRFDAIFRKKGRLWLMENKTRSDIDEEGLQASLSMDLQTMMYCYVIKLMYGEEPEGVLYNVVLRPRMRQGQKETYNDLLNRIDQDVRKDPQKYFCRFRVQFAKTDLTKWVNHTFNPLLTQVDLWWEEIKADPFNPFKNPNRVHHFTNPEGLYTRYGRSEYFEYLTRGSMYGLRKREK